MKKYIIGALIAVFMINSDIAFAQDELSAKEKRKIEKAEKKKKKKEEIAERQAAILNIVKDSTFIVETNTIFNNNMISRQVNPNINFFLIEGDDFVLQTADPHYFGYNGLGGITVEGKISDYKITEGKKNETVQILMQVNSLVTGHATVHVTLTGGGHARARLVDNWGNRITFSGDVNSLENSSVFQGTTMF